MYVGFLCDQGMLAASRSRTNVPPDYLQTAPVIAFAATATNQLCELAAQPVLQANPADLPEQHTAGQKPGRKPCALRIEQEYFTTGGHAQASTKRISMSYRDEFPGAEDQPATATGNRRRGVERQSEKQRDACGAKEHAGQHYNPAKYGIRAEFG
jgi:hypothetical protein